MSGNDLKKEEILKFAKFLGFGFYRVNYDGQFIECDSKAGEVFGIPEEGTDLSKYSIKEFYVTPTEREWRIRRLVENRGKPLCSTLSVRIKDENILLFDMCWCDNSYKDQGNFVGIISKIEESTIFPKMFDTFPMGLYEVDDKNRIVRVNKKMLEIFGYKDEANILETDVKDLYEEEADEEKFTGEIKKKGFAHDTLKLKDVNNKTLDIECFSQNINPYEKARWGMISDVTKRERYYRALDSMPTGYFYVENEHITQCNDQFARIIGFKKKEDALGVDTRKYFLDKDVMQKYFQDLKKAAEKDGAVQGYEFQIRTEDDRILTVSVDSHLVKDSNGKVIGREGTIRDISEKVKLEKKVKNTEERLNKMTADINNLIHTFLHPVLKFSGHAELFQQLGKVLFKSIRLKVPGKTNIQKLGEELENKLIEIQTGLKYISDSSESATVLAPKFETIINVFDYNQDKAEGSKILVDKAIRDAALWVLEVLEQIEFFNKNIKRGKLEELITNEFIEYLQNILFDYLIRTSGILQYETHVMKREVETLRKYIAVGQKKIHSFRMCNIGKILEENIEIFKPILAQKDIEIEYKPPGHIDAMISEIDIDRVICNLLHNANKYSYLSLGRGRVVRIKIRDLYQENAVEFSISSYGIPIKKEEIDNGAIFNFGYRSQFAYKTNRDGTGVGLADARDVIHQHQGTITITSKPVRDDGDPPQYKVPYITTVTVRLPKTRKGEKK